MCSNLPDGCTQGNIDARFGNLSAQAESDLQTICEWRHQLQGMLLQARGMILSDGFQMDELIGGIENQINDLKVHEREISTGDLVLECAA
ncbi:hypothetical protein D3W54_14660 [Komagataeibacter medellinensis]|uniref:Uncharacterized protein n=1 Tax=Komagataeibacter medellinensis TaxID=1177712 RepID=A0ABQ6VR64_9PROT|nr:hypothetical protein [Komagataeibacter medellinensis]KAB8122430.1 hypothetical protein D3W54_14660 [Komagataeibacter medellinensis]